MPTIKVGMFASLPPGARPVHHRDVSQCASRVSAPMPSSAVTASAGNTS
ncbi:hypothetical protein FHS28_002317 [Roseateles terrae]|uniref:Uncharacterized protein n=1 Tax=Roseateles terrae TaxID=431060 RepID=A0ABR6GS40_9BURK|nr:hypothetical protein [Roseateles terrae]